ncbi:MAG: 6-phosphogluconolactonase [Candidatus Kapaibacterium sp.]
MSLKSFPSLESLSAGAAKEIASLANQSAASRGRFTIALSGGSTPRTLYEMLAREYSKTIDWRHVHIFWGDERYVPQDDPASNYRMAKESLLDKINIPEKNIHPIPYLSTPTDSSDAYSKELQSLFKEEIPTLDLILLGLGSDGHTASLFPGMTEEEMNAGIVIVTHSPAPPPIRTSLALQVINNARNVFFLVSGEEKKEILKAVLAEEGNPDSKYPAARVYPRGGLVWFVDEAAMENKK